MSSIKDTAAASFDACETGRGWAACAQYCHPEASFSVQADTFAGLDTVEAYTDALAGLDGDRIRHMTKIWNDVWAMRELGWSA